MSRFLGLLMVALGILSAEGLFPAYALAISFFKEVVSEEAIPNTELKIDSQGNIHAVFVNKNSEIKYAKRSNDNWTFESVKIGDWAPSAQWVSLALDAQDRVHLAFFDHNNNQILYATQTVAGWKALLVAAAYNSQCRIAAYGSGDVYIAFNTGSDSANFGKIFLAHIDAAGVVSIEEVETGDVGYGPSLAVDAAGRPHLTYFDNQLQKLKYAFKGDNGWQISVVDNALMTGWQNALALDAQGWPHIAYYDYIRGNLKYAYKNSSGWHRTTIDSTGQVGQYPALAFGPRGKLFFAYFDATLKDLKIAYKEGSGWKKVALDQDGDTGYHISLVTDNLGEACLLYYDYDSVSKSTKLYYGVATLPRVYLNTPQGGEIWKAGSEQIISWRAAGSPEILYYKLQYFRGTGWSTLASNLPVSQKEYRWLIPAQSGIKNNRRIKILAVGAGGKILSTDLSPYFTLSP
jgi:hypothetical protein